MFTKARYPIEHPLPHLLVEIWFDRATKLDQDDPRLISLREARADSRGRGQVAGWRSRSEDGNKAAEVARAAGEIRARLPEKRVTRSEIALVLGLSGARDAQKATLYWPLTSAAIDLAIETPDAFFKRRLFRQMDLMLSEGNEVAVAPALRRIGPPGPGHRTR